MKSYDLHTQLETYLAVRSAVGFKDQALKLMLHDFVKYVNSLDSEQIHAKYAVEWACTASASCGISGRACRLSAARRFLTYLSASMPEVEIPEMNLLASYHRKPPYIFSKQEIIKLIEVASFIRPRGALRRHTYSTIIGLMASTGLRVGEAIRLKVADVALNSRPSRINIENTKFRKSRIVPLHPSTAKQLRCYEKLRYKMGYAGLSDALFISERGKHLNQETLRKWFKRTVQRLGMIPVGESRSPSLNCLRHTFAVERLTEWCKQGLPVKELMPNLSVYLGHVKPENSYWYLTATPALLLTASDSFQHYMENGGQS